MSKVSDDFIPLQIAVLTVSARRTAQDDTSGDYLREAAQEAGHQIVASAIVKENRYQIQAQVTAWIASETVQVILINGGTGFTAGDVTPEAISPLFDRSIDGFGELFRMVSYEDIGTATIQFVDAGVIFATCDTAPCDTLIDGGRCTPESQSLSAVPDSNVRVVSWIGSLVQAIR